MCRIFAVGDPQVAKDGNLCFVESAQLDPHQGDASRLHEEATELVDFLNGVGGALEGGYHPVSLRGHYRIDGPDGPRQHAVVSADTAEIRVKAEAAVVVIRADGSEEAPISVAPEPPRIAVLSATNSDVREVVHLLAKPDWDWVLLYKVYEVIRDAVGGQRALVTAGLMTEQERSTFTGSANHPGASGVDARHARQSGGGPSRVMTLIDGREFVRHLVNHWVEQL